jgi:hypothetical protein
MLIAEERQLATDPSMNILLAVVIGGPLQSSLFLLYLVSHLVLYHSL